MIEFQIDWVNGHYVNECKKSESIKETSQPFMALTLIRKQKIITEFVWRFQMNGRGI